MRFRRLTTVNMDENIIDEFKVSLKNAKKCVEPTISQRIVVRREVVCPKLVGGCQRQSYRDEDEANEPKCEAENGLEKFRVAVCITLTEGNPRRSSRAVTDTDEDMVRLCDNWSLCSSIALTSFFRMEPRTL